MGTESLNRKQQEELQSKVIDFLRFPLIVGVVFIHCYNSLSGNIIPFKSADMILDENIRNLFSQVIGRISVPLFFLISGFLFFYKVEWDKKIYRKKLISRSRTLLIPYLFWNALALLFSFIITLPFCKAFCPGAATQGFQLSFLECLQGFWADPQSVLHFPFAYQFWFIRDLMVMLVLTPVIYWLIIKFNWSIVLVWGIIWHFVENNNWFPGFSTTAFFFFTLGAYFSINRYNPVEKSEKLFLLSLILYPALACLDLLTKEYTWNFYIHRIGISAGILFIVNLSAWLIQKKNIYINTFLSGASFFVFAVHVPILLEVVRKVLYLLIRPGNGWTSLLTYFMTVFFIVIIALALYKLLKHYLPHFTNVITGGR